MRNKKAINLLEGSLVKNIVRLGYPMALGSLAQMLYNLADTFWLGKLGKEALSAPTISFNIIFFLIAIALGFSVAGTSLVSQYIGAKQKESANLAAGNLLGLLVGASVVFSVCGLLLAEPLLKLLKTPADAYGYTLSYFRIVIAGMPLSFPIFTYQAAMNGYGDTMSPLKISLFTASINLVLDPMLIFGWWGLPELGVNGAAIATVFTRALASGLGLYLFFSGKKGIHLKWQHLKPDIKTIRLVLKIGVPSAVGFSGSAVGFIVLMGFVNTFGSAVISAYGIATRVIHLFMLPAMGISAAVTAIVGQNLGAGNIQRAKDTVGKGLLLMASIIVLPTLLTAAFGREVAMIFIPGDPVVHHISRIMFYITPPSIIFFGITNVLEGAFQGGGHTVPVMVNAIARLWIFRIPLVYFLAFVVWNGPENIDACVGIWWGMTVSNILSFFLIFTWYLKGTWTKARIKKS